jgi:hypothetical protein
VTQGRLIDEKTEGRKSRATVPLKFLFMFRGVFLAGHVFTRTMKE